MQTFRQRAATLKSCLATTGCVAVVLFLLAVVFLPVIPWHDRYHSRQATCQSNLKQIGIAFVQYVQDYDEQFPLNGPHGTGWAGALYPYVKSTGVFKCSNDENVATTTPQFASYPLSYSMNSNFIHLKDKREVSLNQGEIEPVATTVLAFETSGTLVDMTKADEGGAVSPTGFHSGVGNGLAPAPGTGNLTANGRPIRYACGDFPGRSAGGVYGPTRHDPSSMFLSADGHVKLLQPEKVSTGRTPAKSATQTGNAVTGTAASSDRLADGGFTLTFSTH
ncbi:MAG TPA: DUF1559 domain-containing protein [Capsulimonadaceae bacterium]|jgi:hypothetical protein